MEEKKMQYLFGMHPVLEAVRAGKKFDKVLLKQGLEGTQFRELMDLLKENEIAFQFVPGERLNRLTRGAHQGVIAYISQIEYVDIEQLVNNALARDENPLLVILDGVSDVRNLGAIARSLECAGGCGIIVPAKGGAAINADAVKASAAVTAPSRTLRDLSTSTVKSTCPGVSMMLILLPFHCAVVAAEVIVIPRSCSCSIQSIVAEPS